MGMIRTYKCLDCNQKSNIQNSATWSNAKRCPDCGWSIDTFEDTPDICPECNTGLVRFNESKPRCPNCKSLNIELTEGALIFLN